VSVAQSSPRVLLGAADLLLSESRVGLEGRWPAAVTVLLRQSLERSLTALWRSKAPAMEQQPYRVQLLSLRRFIDRDLAASADHAWHALSRACHEGGYDLPPTATELANWYETVEALTRSVERATAATP
jgi:hypothetical protein